ncbi:UDP-glucose dehydrogenase family protein [Bacillus dakarensis]|uniref:UDP-glucose dehydrogenase family protein n=1 Tax=Robertmurraya dakarensis TaxID=1926278 RepID=UPI0009821243|nr:UDP-glucose/GDP-mannose dehydrogenase family protein [Bacillus dakarensis]
MNIAVTGAGYVGLVTGVCLAELGHEVICIDVNEEKIEMLKRGRSPIYEPGLEPLLEKHLDNGRLHFTISPDTAYRKAEIIYIAVGTPQKHDGTVNLDFIMKAAETIPQYIKRDCIICTKSTVPVGTNDKIQRLIHERKPPDVRIDVVSNPEFLREGCAMTDFFNGDRIVIGASSTEAASTIESIYLPLGIPCIKTDIKSAEMIKYASNAFLATKISFINEIAAICEKIGANIEEVTKGIGSDKRIGPHFLQSGIGYGGSCFPKDTQALVQLAGNVQHPFDLLQAVIQVNNRQQSLPVRKAKELLSSLKGKKIALLGLSFKPNTDDIREAASLTIIHELQKEGAAVTAFDPAALPNTLQHLGNSIQYAVTIESALQNADAAIIATEWNEIKHASLDIYEKYMRTAIVIDGRNCYSLKDIQNHNITYISIGRPPIIKKHADQASLNAKEKTYDETTAHLL